ncbi:MAG TPA: PVC-type heme-binding CxxCH protein, partial [Isosphaeraceae bacterium]|nr:PVC-type heme-binding CxxCH protein [Isosphaeraceae bacterium]
MVRRPLLAASALLLLGLVSSMVRAGDSAAPLKVLFLGDKDHHQPSDRAAQLIPVMAGRGIDIQYTEAKADLNAANLAKYDALLIYANITRIEPEQEKALLEYVEGGGGFVPIHCASYCFLNSEPYVALVGAQFQRHSTGEFDTKVVDADHSIMKGFEPFRTWDETYVHTKHNEKERHVLQVRAEGDREEPWTWVRTQGKGRVFYTAYGHDYRTWTMPGFQDLIERGIRWASGKGQVYDSRPRVPAGLKAFEFEPAGANIPNYLPSNRWGTQGEPFTQMQKPVSPEESVKHMVVPHGFEPRLFAAEPQIAKPIAMAWDHRGRLWIGETVDYPNNLQRRGEGHDRISILEDTDNDGQADKFTVFADKLSIPSSLVFANGGLIINQVPNVVFLKDTDGDDKADVRQVLFTGWGTDDTHAGPSNLRWGFDNWIWGIVGYSGYRGVVGGETLDFRQAFYRFKPDGSKLESLRNTNNNSWGVGFSEEGLVFGSTANGCPSVYLPIPNRYYERVRGFSPRVLRMISDSFRFFPITDKVRQVDWFGGFTAGAGHALYTARTYPSQYWNSTAFVSEPTGHLTATFTLQRKGSDVVAHYGWNLVASNDEWTSPIVAEVGPDGHVWVIDWYNYIVQHNPTPQGFKTGKGNAYETPLRDKTHGRIYRIVSKDAKPAPRITLNPSDPRSLVNGLKSDNQFWRLTAQRLLVERGQRDVAPELLALVNDKSLDAIGLNPAAIHALWTLKGLGLLEEGADPAAVTAGVGALRHESAGVRRNALQVLPRNDRTAQAILAANLLNDPDAQVRLAALLALAEMPASDSIAAALAKALVAGVADGDHWLTDAFICSGATHDRAFLAQLAAQKFGRKPSEEVVSVADQVAEHYGRGGPVDSVSGLIVALADSDASVANAIVVGLARGWPRDRAPKLDEATEKAIAQLLPRLSSEARGPIVSLA